MSMIIRQFEVNIFTTQANVYQDVNKVKINFNEVNTPDDSKGRGRCIAYKAKPEFSIMKNTNTDLRALYTLLNANDLVTVAFQDPDGDSSSAIIFKDVHVIPVPVIDGDGNYEAIKCYFTRTISRAKMLDIIASDELIEIEAISGAGGTVTGGGDYKAGITHTITATPDEGYTFVKWIDTLDNTDLTEETSYTFIVDKYRSFEAEFAAIPEP